MKLTDLNKTNQKKEKTQINKIRVEKGNIIADTTEMQRIVKEDFEKLYAINWKI